MDRQGINPAGGQPAPIFRDNFDLLRLLVALLVMARHCSARLDLVRPAWWWFIDILPGVPIFFVVSGFLVSASYERSTSVRAFAESRARRIYPGLWACVLLTVIVATLFGFDFLHLPGFVWGATQLAGLIYTPHFLADFGSGTYNGALWTIPVTLQFYVALPILYLCMSKSRSPNKVLMVVWCASLVLGLVFRPMTTTMEGMPEPINLKLLRYSLVPHLFLFLTGMLLRRLRAHESRFIRGKALAWLAGYVLLMYLWPASDTRLALSPAILALVVISVAYTAGGLCRGFLRSHDISYGLFVYHGLVINLFVELGLTGSVTDALGVAAVTFVVALLSAKFVEGPFLKKRSRATTAATRPARQVTTETPAPGGVQSSG
jgi:peptidoglycan/LPS O-acetylase OafA/YrhL